MRCVLLLNASCEPLKVISWQRAVCMVFADKVDILEEYNLIIRSVSFSMKVPSVLRLRRYARLASRSPSFSRENVLARDGYQCQYCGVSLTSKTATLDHVLPSSRGGKTTWENVVTACRSCNGKKGRKTPEEAKMPLRKTPVKPQFLSARYLIRRETIPSEWEAFVRKEAA